MGSGSSCRRGINGCAGAQQVVNFFLCVARLAQDFHARGNEEASRQTLQFLIQKYPSNRHAPAARAEIESGHVSETDGRAERGGPANDAGPPNEVRDGRESRTDAGK